MKDFQTINIDVEDSVAYLRLSRPEVRNALNLKMITEITEAFGILNLSDTARIIVIKGDGTSFSAGGDLEWMRDVVGQSESEIVADSRQLVKMYEAINKSPKIVIAVPHGAAIAGAIGLIACSDLVITDNSAKFCVSEVKIGLTASIISTYIIPRIGVGWFRYFAKTGVKFDAKTAQLSGLVHEVETDRTAVEERLRKRIKECLEASPISVHKTRELIQELGYDITLEKQSIALVSNAKARSSMEAQEGIKAFLNKSDPSWKKPNS